LHISVLKKGVVKLLDPKPNQNFVDATVNGGGHAQAILARTGPGGKLLAIDWDKEVLQKFKKRAVARKIASKIVFIHDNFANIRIIVNRKGLTPIAGIIADLGLSSWQLEKSGRGFSFQKDEPLIMNFGQTSGGLTAGDLVNGASEKELADIIYRFGEERQSRQIAHALVAARRRAKISTSRQLAEIIKTAVGWRYRRQKIHPATRTFQALRIAVNDELGNLEKFLNDAFAILPPSGKLAIISFHSLEDRLIKNFYRQQQKQGTGEILTKKPIRPDRQEIIQNPKSRSAKLRAIKKIA